MGNKQQLILIILGILLLLVVIIIVVLVRNTRKTKFAKQIEDINVRFNAIKTIPLAFKLNKAQAMARRNKDTAEQIESYYKQYENTQRDIDSINDMLVEIDDDFANHNYKSLKSLLSETEDFIAETEKEVTQIDKFLEQFADKENQQREFSTRLKERYLEVKMKVNEHSNSFSIAYDGVCRIKDTRCGAVVLVEDYILVGAERDEHVRLGPSPLVDGLVRISHHEEIATHRG